MYPENQRIIPAIIVSASVGILLWEFIPGLMQFLVSIDFESMNKANITFHVRILVFLCLIGALMGIVCQSLAIFGGYIRSQAVILFAPMIAGIIIGIFQGYAISSELLGLENCGFVFRSLSVRIISGAICGFVVVPPLMTVSIWIRRKMP